jgi:hypothetical protein
MCNIQGVQCRHEFVLHQPHTKNRHKLQHSSAFSHRGVATWHAQLAKMFGCGSGSRILKVLLPLELVPFGSCGAFYLADTCALIQLQERIKEQEQAERELAAQLSQEKKQRADLEQRLEAEKQRSAELQQQLSDAVCKVGRVVNLDADHRGVPLSLGWQRPSCRPKSCSTTCRQRRWQRPNRL